MTEATARDAAQDALAITADTMGHDFLAALLNELRSMPDHWARLNEQKQQQIIENLRVKVRTGIDKAVGIMLRSEFPAVQADVDSVGFKGGIVATLKIPRDALFRHQLADAQGSKVMVVMADPARWLQRMEEIKAKGDQIDLFDADYDPARDQPSYRRDQDRIAPAAPTWEDLKQSLKKAGGDTPTTPGGETAPADQDTPPPVELPTEYKAEAAQPIDRRKDDGEWEPVKLKQIARGDVIRVPGFDAAMIAKTPALKDKGGVYIVQVEPEPALLFGSALDAEQEKQAAAIGLQELLASVGVAVSLGAVQAFSPEQVASTSEWVQAYAQNPEGCKIARPLWLPIPEPKGGEA